MKKKKNTQKYNLLYFNFSEATTIYKSPEEAAKISETPKENCNEKV